MKITKEVLEALRAATADGNLLYLAGPRMTPRKYRRVNEVIEGAGGRWDKNTAAHVFPGDAAEAIAPVLETGYVTTRREIRQASQYFPTPTAIVTKLAELADLKPDMEVLEPSAGRGAIVAALAERGAVVDCVERDPEHAAALEETGLPRSVTVADFLTVPASPKYDRVVMNPPFAQGADVQHVRHALRFLKPGGLLVAVMSWAVTWRGGEEAKFRALVEHRGGHVEAVAEGAFAASGTDIETIIVAVPAVTRRSAGVVVWPIKEAPAAPEPDDSDPLEILAGIRENLRESMSIFDDLERMLTEPAPKAEPSPMPLPHREREEQLTFDDWLGEAS